MTTISLVRQDGRLSQEEKLTFFSLLLRFIDGLGDTNKKRIRRLFNWLLALEPGEMATIEVVQPRSTPFHRFHMKLESSLFEAQERIETFDQFRYWLKVGSGHVVWLSGVRGGVIPVPKSISYAELDEAEYREFHDNCLKFLREGHAAKFLWPHLSPAVAAEMMESVLENFDK